MENEQKPERLMLDKGVGKVNVTPDDKVPSAKAETIEEKN